MNERERLIELIGSKVCEAYDSNCDEWQPHSCEKCYANDCRIGDLADYLLANGVLCLPWKVGDTVYFHDDYVWTCDCRECDHFCPGYCGDPNECLKTNSSRKSPECIGIKEKTVAKEILLQYLYWEDFGKTVFLSREEAEAALAERSKKT